MTVEGRSLRVAVDIGGTFVDGIEFDPASGRTRLYKSSTTPRRPWEGVFDVLEGLRTPLEQVELFIHGTTLGLNAVLERRGATVGVITNEGFRDMFLIGRAAVPDQHMYDFQYEAPPSLVSRRHLVGVRGRVDAKGRIVEALDEDGARQAARYLVESHGVNAIAVCCLHSYRDAVHERRIAELITEAYPHIEVSASVDLVQEYREYERTSTTVIDAYIRPIFAQYVDRLEGGLRQSGFGGRFLVMRSGGGAMEASQAKRSPTHTILSGPAGGIVGASHVAKTLERGDLLTFDVGGTSLDTCVIERGEPVAVHEAELELYPLLIPVYDIRTIGAGGGSIASIERGLLKVGPQSAGAEPGPICYGRGGTEPTVTDSALELGYLDPERFLAGGMRLDAEAAHRGLLAKVAEPLGLSCHAAAAGMLGVLLARTVGAVRAITVERGRDPRTFSLLAFGGAGPLLGPLLGREMGLREVIVPPRPAAFSAWGMLAADIVDSFSRTDLRVLEEVELAALEVVFAELEKEAGASLRRQGVAPGDILLERELDLRYLGQEHALTLTVGRRLDRDGIRRAFEEQHELRYGHTLDNVTQVLTVRVQGIGRSPNVELAMISDANGTTSDQALVGRRPAWCFARGKLTEFAVVDRARLRAGHTVAGPAVVDEGTSTTVIHSDQLLRVDRFGNLLIAPAGLGEG
jgi:N-methylhydantoinase A